MQISSTITDRIDALIKLFTSTFAESEGTNEGAVIGGLVADLMAQTPPSELRPFVAFENDKPIGAIIFTRLFYDDDSRTVFLLSPVAVATDQQGQGVGQRLLNHGLEALRQEGVDIVITYGDPNYYRRVGFEPITEAIAAAPQPLQYPEGWLGQSLTSMPLTPLKGTSRCATALDNPAYW